MIRCISKQFACFYRLVMFTYGANLFNRREVLLLLSIIQILLVDHLGCLYVCQILV